MNRREFTKLLAFGGLATTSLPLMSLKANAAGAPSQFLVTVGLAGGWDMTSFTDPKGRVPNKGSVVNNVELDPTLKVDLHQAIDQNDPLKDLKSIRWSAIPSRLNNSENIEAQYRKFFETYSNRISLIQGVNTMTSSHVLGTIATFSGFFGSHPALGALFGAVHGPDLPLSFLSFGGQYAAPDLTAGVPVNKARLNSNATLMNRLGNPNFHQNGEVYDLLKSAHKDRVSRLIEKERNSENGLELRLAKFEKMLAQRSEENIFGPYVENLRQINNDDTFNPFWTVNQRNGLMNQALTIAAAFATGVTCAGHISSGGFDSHTRHDDYHYRNLGAVLESLHFLVEALDYFGVSDRTTIVVGSDVGRLPFYNNSGGKDHSGIGGYMVIHPRDSIYGGRVFGQTTERFGGQHVNAITGAPDPSGVRVNIRHVLASLQQNLGIYGTSIAAEHDLGVNPIPQMFTPLS